MVRLLPVLLFLLLSVQSFATHIVGGEVLYRHLGNNRYEITLNLFIDCINGQPGAIAQDEYALFTIFSGNDNSLIDSLCKSVIRNSPERITKLNYDCIALPPNACVDKYIYTDTFNLPPMPGGYIIAFQRCCRNYSINNLVNPGGTGATYWTHIQDTAGGYNNSAYFKELPPNFLCTNAPLKFDHSAIDPDGDSLVYELYHPFHGATDINPRPSFYQVSPPPFVKVNFANGYSDAHPINGNPALAINTESGFLTLTPSQQGQYVIGILVKEYRKGVLVGITRRDYQFNVLNCQFQVVSAYKANDSICGYKVFFDNNSSGANIFSWDFGDTLTTEDTSSLQKPEYTYPGPGKYNVRLTACDGNCCDSSVSEVTVLEPLDIDIGSDTTFCGAFEYTIGGTDSTAKYLWNTGDTTRTITTHKPGIYWVKASRCNVAYDSITIATEDFSDFTIPNAFSPNGDNMNDYYPLMDHRVTEYSVRIYNRWGEKMYETENSGMWDGKFKNDDVPP
ncbi:MAG TPA: gliding motility-associated C-terminal domain-containing protein, partial [Bacteroidia bacterium]|nr:gliding motility-associated C-terminal domain-containing protein [Bacteroidia bacterium]